jgi:hypothetical protein
MTGAQFPVGARNFFFTAASRLAQGPTQLLIQWVPEAGIKRPGHEAYSFTSSADVKNAWDCITTPPMYSWRGAYLSTGTTLPYIVTIITEQ